MINPKVLLIDDDQVISLGTSKRLIKRGFDVDTVSSGLEVIDKIKKENYELILLDIKMPEISGLEVLELIRKDYPKNHLPVIMFSSCDEDDDIINALKLGANDYISKPVNIDVLLSRINVQLELKSLSEEYAKKEQLEAITAMTVTFNHEINNLLVKSMGRLNSIKKKRLIPEESFDKIYKTQEDILEVVNKINKVTEENQLVFTKYSDKTKMVKI